MSSVLLYGLKTKCLSTTNSKRQHPKKKGMGRVRGKGQKSAQKLALSESQSMWAKVAKHVVFYRGAVATLLCFLLCLQAGAAAAGLENSLLAFALRRVCKRSWYVTHGGRRDIAGYRGI